MGTRAPTATTSWPEARPGDMLVLYASWRARGDHTRGRAPTFRCDAHGALAFCYGGRVSKPGSGRCHMRCSNSGGKLQKARASGLQSFRCTRPPTSLVKLRLLIADRVDPRYF